MDKKSFSTTEVAKILGISRQAILKKIKLNQIKARKTGRNFVIDKNELPEILEDSLTERKKEEIEKSVDKTVREYGETLKLLGKE